MSAQAEADLAAALYVELADFRAAAERRGVSIGGCEVGIVTPYKQQKACLRDTFLRAAGPEASSKVRITPPPLTVFVGGCRPQSAVICRLGLLYY